VAVINMDKCNRCGACQYLCRFHAINGNYEIDPFSCEGCAVCVYSCPRGLVTMKEKTAGEWFVSETRLGPLVHARLNPGEENSGKLVSIVRSKARSIAEEKGFEFVLIDGSPGIGCPVIASVTGASLVLAVTEPTLSGLHDLDRILSLAGHFRIPSAVCINKFDINPEMADTIEKYCDDKTIPVIGRVPFDPVVTKAQVASSSVVEYSVGGAALEIRKLWREVCYRMEICEKESGRI
jgi:MinD superfamily P-loop ATPase